MRLHTLLAAASAVAAVWLFLGLLHTANSDGSSSSGLKSAVPTSRRLLHSADTPHFTYTFGKWGVRHIVGLALSIGVSLLSSVDRECGSSLYMVLFACLLDLPFRQAAAMTAFTVALGALGPGIASMCEAHITERGLLAVVDYPGALILLPTMFWGISFGVMVNLWAPNWLLALLWVLIALGNNIELLVSLRKYHMVKQEAKQLAQQLSWLQMQPHSWAACSVIELACSFVGLRPPAAASGTTRSKRHSQQQQQPQQQTQQPASEQQQQQQQHISRHERESTLVARAHALAEHAQQIEAVALLYPVLYTPSVEHALRVAELGPAPDTLRQSATPSLLCSMDQDSRQLAAELLQHQRICGRFTLSWAQWTGLNRHFELSMVLKVVVMHLVTEAIRHHLSKPCTTQFWVMVCGMTGLVTGFLLFTVYCYSTRRLWRGPHWVDALAQVSQMKKQQQLHCQELTKDIKPSQPTAAAAAVRHGTAGAAAGAAGDALAVNLLGPRAAGSRLTPAVLNATIVVSEGTAGSRKAVQLAQERDADASSSCDTTEEQPAGCAAKLRARLPWFWGPAEEAITNISDCNSWNQYSSWRLPRMLLCAAAGLPIGILGCALGLPSGPHMSHILLALGLKPHVVAATSRFLTLCFMFGSFVAHIITGNLEPSLAAAYGLLNLGLAPLGLLLFTKLKPRGIRVLWMSLAMGVSGFVLVTVGQLVPLMADLMGHHDVTVGRLGPATRLGRDAAASVMGLSNTFQLGRFCDADH